VSNHITLNFKRSEFACPCCGWDIVNPYLVHRLQVVRDILGAPITITSGCRCYKHNATKEVGGKPGSLHLRGEAADWTVEDKELLEAAARMLHNWSGGFHYYPEKGFIHTDIGPHRRW